VTRPTTPDACLACQGSSRKVFAISTAFQPIVDISTREIFAYEALVRGPEGQSAPWVLAQVGPEDLYAFDQQCRVTAIHAAARLGIATRLSINFMPNAVYTPSTCIQATLRAARDTGMPLDRLMFEVTEHEKVVDQAHVRHIIDAYRAHGFMTALDDYGVGHATAQLLVAIRPDILKLDMALVRGVQDDPWRQALIRAHLAFARETGTLVIAEGIETLPEARALAQLGVTLMQGYHFARPGLETLPVVSDHLIDQIS